MKKFRSKIGIGIVSMVGLLLGTSLAASACAKEWVLFAVVLAILILVVYLLLTTFYVIENGILSIHSGFLSVVRIEIRHVIRIEKRRNLFASRAGSINRLEIIYNKYDSVLISPKDKEGFIKEIKRINPFIELEL